MNITLQKHHTGHWLVDSQDGAGLEVFLIHPFGLAYLQDLCVAQVLQATLELVQGIRLECQRSHDLLPHHLHYLQRKEKRRVRSSRMQEQHRLWRDCESSQEARANPLPIFGGSEEHINVCSVPNRINDEVFIFFFPPALEPLIQSGALSLKRKRAKQNNSTAASQLLASVKGMTELAYNTPAS